MSTSVPGTLLPTPSVAARAALAPTMQIDNASRASVRAAYQQWYKPTLAVPAGWTGNVSTCNAGSPSTAGQNATLSMVNYFREMVGVDPAIFSADLSSRAQQAALMMDANNDLSHEPPESWRCWTKTGHDAAGSSNLSLGVSGANAIDGYMRDPGPNNLAVGHRRWVTSPDRTLMGSGSTHRANALYVLTQSDPDATVPKIIGWPTPGYFPSTLDPNGRWSFTITDWIMRNPFLNTRVSVRETSGIGHQADVVNADCTYGMGCTITFQVKGTALQSGQMDRHYRITFTGIDHPSFPPEYTYYVSLFDPETTSPPAKDPPPPIWVWGTVEGIKATGTKVSFYGRASNPWGDALVSISRDGKTIGTLRATRPRTDGYKGWLYEPTDTPGTHKYCAHFPNSSAPGGFITECRNVVVK